ncbi:MAG: CoA-disulfide reductase [Candidatus Saccharibacteria bacterium]
MSGLIIIGGVAGGMSAAAKARRTKLDLPIRVYNTDSYISYAGCGLPYFIGGSVKEVHSVVPRTPEFFAGQKIEVKTRHAVESLNTAKKTVTVRNLETNSVFEDNYDKLIISTGARPLVPPMPGTDLEGVFVLRSPGDAIQIRSYLEEKKPRSVVIVGGGYIGLEMVESVLEYGCQVTVIERAPQLIATLDADMAGLVQEYLEMRGVNVAINADMKGLIGEGKVSAVQTADGEIPADLVLLSLGVKPNTEFAAEAGIELGFKGAIRVNERMETNIPGIYAAGDCATVKNLASGQEAYIPMGTTANKQGRVAGINAAGGSAHFKGVVGTGVARVIDLEIARTGLTERECKDLNISFISKTIKDKTTAHFFADAPDITLKVVAEAGNGRILGGQIIGGRGAGKRIDILAVAISLRHTIDDMIDLDLAYSPPFAPVWDPILVALNQF